MTKKTSVSPALASLVIGDKTIDQARAEAGLPPLPSSTVIDYTPEDLIKRIRDMAKPEPWLSAHNLLKAAESAWPGSEASLIEHMSMPIQHSFLARCWAWIRRRRLPEYTPLCVEVSLVVPKRIEELERKTIVAISEEGRDPRVEIRLSVFERP